MTNGSFFVIIGIMIEIAQTFIPYGIMALQVAGVILLLALLFDRRGKLVSFAGQDATTLGFLLTLAAAGGSLFYSNVIGFEPCLLCWWQRIFMYPQIIMFTMAMWKKRTDIFLYSLPLSVIGTGVAIYQILLPTLEKFGVACVTSTGVSCAKLYVFAFGYITIPVMSLTIFGLLILLAISNKLNKTNAGQ